MKANSQARLAATALLLAVALFPANAFADAMCLFATCPGAPLSPGTVLPGPVSVFEGQQFVLAAPVVPGDTVLFDGPGLAFPGDVLRFFSGGPIFLFSDDPGTEPEDTGLPLLGTNVFSMVEGPSVPTLYTAGPPGAQNTYFIFSDVSIGPDVPEPRTAVLVALGVIAVALGFIRRV